MPAALRQLAQRILEAAFDVNTIAGKLPGVSKLTEELLLLASDAVEVVAAAAPWKGPNGKAQLLTSLVAGAMGSQKIFDKADGERLGLRFKMQVKRVREERPRAAADTAVRERRAARAAAARDTLLAAGLPEMLASIDAREKAALVRYVSEVYKFDDIAAPEEEPFEEPLGPVTHAGPPPPRWLRA